jgi:hypothetical protein
MALVLANYSDNSSLLVVTERRKRGDHGAYGPCPAKVCAGQGRGVPPWWKVL